jgi:hypothetical protein
LFKGGTSQPCGCTCRPLTVLACHRLPPTSAPACTSPPTIAAIIAAHMPNATRLQAGRACATPAAGGHTRQFVPPAFSTPAAHASLLHIGRLHRLPATASLGPLPQLRPAPPALSPVSSRHPPAPSLDSSHPLNQLRLPISSAIDADHRHQARPPHGPSITGEQPT